VEGAAGVTLVVFKFSGWFGSLPSFMG